MPVNPEWLKQVKEESLEPELRICDPHHNLWDHPVGTMLFLRCLSNVCRNTGMAHQKPCLQ